MEIKNSKNWYFPPTLNKHGVAHGGKFDHKTVYIVNTTLFDSPVIAMSDIHSQTTELFGMLDNLVDLSKFVVLAAGDMAGKCTLGTDGVPTNDYIFMNERAKEFYFVQGNHDLPDENNIQNTLKNGSGIHCNIKNGTTINTSIGKIGGVNGIISDKEHPYKMSYDSYFKYLKKALQFKPRILITHDTPSIPVYYEKRLDDKGNKLRYIGNVDIYKTIDSLKPKIHFYGHCYHPTFHNLIGGVNYINLDSRVIIFIPQGIENIETLFKNELSDEYSEKALCYYK
jgi:Icc-related predicted phosphoesterase